MAGEKGPEHNEVEENKSHCLGSDYWFLGLQTETHHENLEHASLWDQWILLEACFINPVLSLGYYGLRRVASLVRRTCSFPIRNQVLTVTQLGLAPAI